MRRGAVVHWTVLVERPLEFYEEDDLLSFRAVVSRLSVIDHPRLTSSIYRCGSRLREILGMPARLGGRSHVPARLLRFLAASSPRPPDAVVACGEHLATCLSAFPEETRKVLDVPRIGSEAYRDHVGSGRGEDLEVFADEAREMRLVRLAGAVISGCAEDARALRARGYEGPIFVIPPAGQFLGGAAFRRRDGLPPGSARLLYVGSPTAANLDGLFWFRRHVLPRLLQAVPRARLRVVGEIARSMDPAPGIDRVGRVDELEEEYRAAAAVVLPLRMGSGVHRRAVEAIVRGKALATTRLGAAGTGLTPGRDAIVTDDPGRMAAELARVVDSAEARCALEEAAARLARAAFDPSAHYAGLSRLLGLPGAEGIEAAERRPSETIPA